MKLTSAIALATIASANIAQGERFVSPNVDLSMQDQLVEIDDSYENSYEHEDAYLDENGLMNYSNVPIPETTFNDMTDIHGNSMLTNLANSYSEDASKVSVRFASIAYCARYHGGKIKNWSCKACKTVSNNMVDAEPFHISANNTNGYVGYDKSRNIVVVAFAGTDPTSFRNVFTDLNTFAVKYHGCKDCKVHAGFYNAYMKSRSTIINLIKKKMRSGSRVLVTGHSLGGALAAHLIADLRTSVFSFATPNTVSIAGVDADEDVESTFLGSDNPAYEVNLDDLQAAMESEDPNVPAPTIDQLMNRIDEHAEQLPMLQSTIQAMSFPVAAPSFTFGQPRLGNQQFANWFTNGVFRVTHNRDPVPHLPPMAFGFRHPKTEIFYPAGQKTFKVCASAEDKKCSNQFIFQLGFTDHISYVRYPICNSLSIC